MLPSRYELSDLQWEKIKDFLLGRAQHVGRTAAKAVIPPKRNRKVQREYDKELYKQRNRIERCFSKLKCLRRFATRYEKSPLATKNQKPASTPWSHSPALGCISGYMSIRPGLVEPVEGSATDKVLNSTGAALASTLKPSHRSCFERLTP